MAEVCKAIITLGQERFAVTKIQSIWRAGLCGMRYRMTLNARSWRHPVGTRFVKEFDDGLFEGIVRSYDGDFYTVDYQDGDWEHLEEFELDALLAANAVGPLHLRFQHRLPPGSIHKE